MTTTADRKSAEKVSRHIRFVIDELRGARFEKFIVPNHLEEAERLLALLDHDPRTEDLEAQMLLIPRLFVAANSLYAKYESAAEQARQEQEDCAAKLDPQIRAKFEATEQRVTEDKVKNAVKADPAYNELGRHVTATSELEDVFYGLREALRMRHEALQHISNNRRAELKLEA